MSPRVKSRAVSREYQQHLDEQGNVADAAHEFAVEKQAALDRTLRKYNLPRMESGGDGAYADRSRSWFFDMAYATMSNAVSRDVIPPPFVGSQGEALERLRSVGRERRDISTTVTAGGNFVPSGSPPSFVAQDFSVAAHNAAVLASTMRVEDMPATGMTVTIPRLSGAASTSVAVSDNAAVAEVDPVTATSSSGVATISGQVDASEQLVDRSDPPIDQVIAEELGASYGANLDLAVINGSGGAGQLSGLLVLAGTTSITATTATAVANFAACGKLVGDVSTSWGTKPDTLIMHPRRAAFIRTTIGYNPQWPVPNVIESPAVPVTLGGTQDAIVTLVRDQTVLFVSPPRIRVMADIGSGTLTVRISAYGYAASVIRQPASVGKATGAGLAAPTYTL